MTRDDDKAGRRPSRRQFLTGAAAGMGWVGIYAARRLLYAAPQDSAQEQEMEPRAYLPLVLSQYPPVKVVHVHAPGATDWDFSSDWYGYHVGQPVVDQMVERGLTELTGTASVGEAWAAILPGYEVGQKIAIKVNLNNCGGCGDNDNVIDALIEPVNAVVGSLVEGGVQEGDVWVYDASRPMPQRFYNRRRHTQAHYIDHGGCADEVATFEHIDESLRVQFSHPAMQTARWLTDLLYQATYLIDLPILKRHGAHPVTLGFKNHFGSLDNLGGAGDDNPHAYINPNDSRYTADFSPLVDIYSNPNIAGKTVLTLADGLFGAPSVAAVPIPWSNTFGASPNSLLFSRDPVAIECVMCDLLRAEWGLNEAAYDFLRLAEERGLGRFERGEPWGAGYSRFQYSRIELPEEGV
jgi:hypothetical protein